MAQAISASPASRMSTVAPGEQAAELVEGDDVVTSLEAMTRWRWLAS
jgi:hypothetical protein